MSHTGVRIKVTVPDHTGDQQPILLADSDWLHMNAIMQGGPPDLTPEMVFEGKPPEYPWVPILKSAKQESGLVVAGIEIWIQAVNLADSYPDDSEMDECGETFTTSSPQEIECHVTGPHEIHEGTFSW